eukprot:COSAG01_NODE_3323_length_6256_cov_2.121813_1_plen_76_part_00
MQPVACDAAECATYLLIDSVLIAPAPGACIQLIPRARIVCRNALHFKHYGVISQLDPMPKGKTQNQHESGYTQVG